MNERIPGIQEGVEPGTQTPLVSVISATYGHEYYISDCIRSVKAQTYPYWEMLIVDDGSPDRTYETALSEAGEDPRIKIFRRENVGIFRLGETYNYALSMAKGKYIAVLEGDDVWLPEKLALQVAALESDPEAVMSWGRAYCCNRDLSERKSLLPVPRADESVYRNDPPGILIPEFFFSLFIPALTLVFRRETLLSAGGFIQKYHLPLVDVTTCLAMLLRGRFVFIGEPLGCWRTYPDQITKTHMVEMTQGFYQMAADFYDENRNHSQVKEMDRKALDDYYRRKLIVSYSRSGRFKLIRKDFRGARRDYIHSITFPGVKEPLWRLRSLTGLVFSLFHLNVEGLARRMGKVSYR